jgi:hypothetical protein
MCLANPIIQVGECQAAKILDKLTVVRMTVKAHTEMNKHTQPSNLLYVPKVCSLDLPVNCPAEWIPPVNNRRALTEEVNGGIKAMNIAAQVNYLKLHMKGIRIDKKSNKTLHKHNPVKPMWRETEVMRRLHLTTHHEARIAVRATKLFMGGLTNIGNWANA